MRLTDSNLLNFKEHLLSDAELLDLTEELLDDFRDEVVISTIKTLHRRDGVDISKLLAKIVRSGSEAAANTALIALGCI